MKKALLLFAATLLSAGAWAQTIVSTQPQNRNVIIEELTGFRCQWCPAGHKIVNDLMEAYPGQITGINVHAGGFSQNSPYNTTYGEAYDTQADPDGYPAGTVNRHVFQDLEPGTTALGRQYFEPASLQIMNMPSPVNVAAVGRFNETNRTVELHIEIYYTGNSAVSTNYLNVAVLQNNVMGQQSGGDANYPEMMENGLYRHMHMLREMLTGTWGEPIPATQGTFIDTTIVWTVPQAIGQVPIPDLNDLDFVVFIAEGHQEIITGVKAMIITEKPAVSSFKVYQYQDCGLYYQPYVVVTNTTESDLTNFVFDYNGETITSNKTINSFDRDTINMPLYGIELSGAPVQSCTATKTVSLVSCETLDGSGIAVNSPAKTITFADFNIYSTDGPFRLKVGIDCYGAEASVALVDQASCTPVWTEGPWSNVSPGNPQYVSQIPDARYYFYTFSPSTPGLYILRAIDSYGDGWTWTNNTNTSGLWLTNASGEIFSLPMGYTNGEAFSQLDFYLNVTNSGDGSHVDIYDADPVVDFSIYPNPATDRLSISGVETVREVSVLDIAGRTVMTLVNTNSVDVSGLSAGVYMVRIATENGIGVQKFVKE
jgi:hypothetical protein